MTTNDPPTAPNRPGVPPSLLGAVAAPAALPAVAARRRVRQTSPSPVGRPRDDGGIAVPVSGFRARCFRPRGAISTATTATTAATADANGLSTLFIFVRLNAIRSHFLS